MFFVNDAKNKNCIANPWKIDDLSNISMPRRTKNNLLMNNQNIIVLRKKIIC